MKALKIALSAGLILVSTAALALPMFIANFNEVYKIPKGSTLDKAGCVVCHTANGAAKLNTYGEDMKKAMAALKTGKKLTPAVLKKIEGLDSDKDGVKNGAEIKKGTLPGDPKSK